MQRNVVSTIVKLAILSLIIGFALKFFGIEPRDLVTSLGDTVVSIYKLVLDFIRWSVEYVLIGAVVVIPIWLVIFLVNLAKKKKGGS